MATLPTCPIAPHRASSESLFCHRKTRGSGRSTPPTGLTSCKHHPPSHRVSPKAPVPTATTLLTSDLDFDDPLLTGISASFATHPACLSFSEGTSTSILMSADCTPGHHGRMCCAEEILPQNLHLFALPSLLPSMAKNNLEKGTWALVPTGSSSLFAKRINPKRIAVPPRSEPHSR